MMERIKLHDKSFKVLIPAVDIDVAVERVAQELNRDYAGRTPIFLGVLSGSMLFMSDLLRKTDFNSELSFVKLSSYQGVSTTGEVKLELGLECDIEGRDVIIVEDIVETGHTMKFLIDYLKLRNPSSIAICTLFFKPERFLYEFKIDYVAISIGNEFIAGYGLDYNELGRNLKHVYVVDK